jgi:hypothetical protein
LSSLGWLLIFVIVIMPGIGKLDNGGFLRAFQVIDGVIQSNQPVFVTVWIGSVVALVVCCGLGLAHLEDDTVDKVLLAVATGAYLVTQVTTFTINVPMNNRVKVLHIANMEEFAKHAEREVFEARWNWWNGMRTAIMGAVSIYLLNLTLRI